MPKTHFMSPSASDRSAYWNAKGPLEAGRGPFVTQNGPRTNRKDPLVERRVRTRSEPDQKKSADVSENKSGCPCVRLKDMRKGPREGKGERKVHTRRAEIRV